MPIITDASGKVLSVKKLEISGRVEIVKPILRSARIQWTRLEICGNLLSLYLLCQQPDNKNAIKTHRCFKKKKKSQIILRDTFSLGKHTDEMLINTTFGVYLTFICSRRLLFTRHVMLRMRVCARGCMRLGILILRRIIRVLESVTQFLSCVSLILIFSHSFRWLFSFSFFFFVYFFPLCRLLISYFCFVRSWRWLELCFVWHEFVFFFSFFIPHFLYIYIKISQDYLYYTFFLFYLRKLKCMFFFIHFSLS